MQTKILEAVFFFNVLDGSQLDFFISLFFHFIQSRHIMLARGRISPVSVIDNVQSPGEVRAGKCDVAVSEAHVFIAGFGHGLS